jgi:Protein of unknown function (DUF1570)
MRFRFLAALLLLGSIVTLSRADYVLIRINLKVEDASPQPGQPQPGQPQPGQPQPTQPGYGQPRPVQPRGKQGRGQMSRGQPPYAQAPYGQPPAGQPSTSQPPFGQPPPKQASVVLRDGEYVLAVVELKGAPRQIKVKELPSPMTPNGSPVWFLEHKWGRSAFDPEHYAREIQLHLITPSELKTPLAQYTERRNAIMNGQESGLDRHLDLAIWCLEVGLPDKCQEQMKYIEKTSTAKDAKVSARVARALEAYKQVTPIISDDVAKQGKAAEWKQKLRYLSVAVSKHYALVHNSEDPARDGVQRRLDALENNFKTFYLLFALKGKALPAPAEKLPAIFVADSGTFNKVMQTFEVGDLVSDGFYACQDNLTVFAPNRVDPGWGLFNQEMRQIYQKYTLDLLGGKFPDFSRTPGDIQSKAPQVARAQIYALVEAALQEESEIATATHEGTLQLFTATGLLPRNTAVPEWFRFGLASLFEMPKGPFAGKNASMVRLAFWPGAGGPNWEWRRYFDEMVQDHLIPEQPTELLWQTLNGSAFDRAQELFATPPGDGVKNPFEAAQTEIARGRCLTWALSYYLFTDKFPDFLTFLNDLANQPRDVELDQYLFLMTFCNAFHIDTAGLTSVNLKGNLNAYDEFAKGWINGVKRVAIPAVNLKLDDPNAVNPADPKNPNRTPKNP